MFNRNKTKKQLLLNNHNTNILHQNNEVKVYFVGRKTFHPNVDKQKNSTLVFQKNPSKEFDSHTNLLCTKIIKKITWDIVTKCPPHRLSKKNQLVPG